MSVPPHSPTPSSDDPPVDSFERLRELEQIGRRRWIARRPVTWRTSVACNDCGTDFDGDEEAGARHAIWLYHRVDVVHSSMTLWAPTEDIDRLLFLQRGAS